MKKKGLIGYFERKPYVILVMPTVFLLAMLVIVPTIFLYATSLTNFELGYAFDRIKFIGLENYIRMFSGRDQVFWHSIKISILLMIVTTSVQLMLGFIIASLLNYKDFKLKVVVIAALIIPISTTPSIAAQIWKLMLNSEYGVINYILEGVLNFSVVWLSPQVAFFSVALIDIWQYTPYMALILYSGLRSLPGEPFEAARVDGANAFQSIIHITLPLLKPLIIILLLFRSTDALKLFDITYVLTQGGPGNSTEFMSLHIFRLGFAQTGFIGRAAAMSVILVLVITFISNIMLKFYRSSKD